jgi:hypothetical protein
MYGGCCRGSTSRFPVYSQKKQSKISWLEKIRQPRNEANKSKRLIKQLTLLVVRKASILTGQNLALTLLAPFAARCGCIFVTSDNDCVC